MVADPAASFPDGGAVLAAIAAGVDDAARDALLLAHAKGVALRHRPIAYPATPRLARTRLRVGYLIDPRAAPEGATAALSLLRAHDRGAFECFAYLLDGDAGDFAGLPAVCDAPRPAVHLAAHEVAGLVRVDDIDVLVDAVGIASEKACQLRLYRPARAIIALLGPVLDPQGPALETAGAATERPADALRAVEAHCVAAYERDRAASAKGA